MVRISNYSHKNRSHIFVWSVFIIMKATFPKINFCHADIIKKQIK